MDFQEYIKPELLILIPVLYAIGVAVKKCEINDKHIPLILGFLGIAFAAVYLFATEPFTVTPQLFAIIFTSITQGVLCAGASVYVNQLIKQESKKDEE